MIVPSLWVVFLVVVPYFTVMVAHQPVNQKMRLREPHSKYRTLWPHSTIRYRLHRIFASWTGCPRLSPEQLVVDVTIRLPSIRSSTTTVVCWDTYLLAVHSSSDFFCAYKDWEGRPKQGTRLGVGFGALCEGCTCSRVVTTSSCSCSVPATNRLPVGT